MQPVPGPVAEGHPIPKRLASGVELRVRRRVDPVERHLEPIAIGRRRSRGLLHVHRPDLTRLLRPEKPQLRRRRRNRNRPLRRIQLRPPLHQDLSPIRRARTVVLRRAIFRDLPNHEPPNKAVVRGQRLVVDSRQGQQRQANR